VDAIAAGGSLTLLGSTVFNYPTGLGPEDARLSPGGRTLYVVDTGARAVSAFAVDGSSLTELRSSRPGLACGAVLRLPSRGWVPGGRPRRLAVPCRTGCG
jgi:hypothetical protein